MNDAEARIADQHAPSQVEIEALVASLATTWNRGDGKGFAARFTADGSFTNVLGMTFHGRDAFEHRHGEVFSTIFRGSEATFVISSLRLLRADVAVADIDATVAGYAALPPGVQAGIDGRMRSKLQAVFVKEQGGWWITAYHNVAVMPLPPRM